MVGIDPVGLSDAVNVIELPLGRSTIVWLAHATVPGAHAVGSNDPAGVTFASARPPAISVSSARWVWLLDTLVWVVVAATVERTHALSVTVVFTAGFGALATVFHDPVNATSCGVAL